MADGYGIDKLEEYIDSLRDGGVTFEIQNLSKEVQQVLTYLVKMWDQTVKGDVPTQKELKELQKGFYAYLQSSQITTKETRNYVSMMFAQLLTRIDKLDKNRALHSMNANISNMVNSGVLDTSKKGAQNNVLAQLLKGGFLSPVTNSITSFQDKLMSFLNIEKGQEKTKKRQFVEDLVEGLARSKFVGGALSDFIKLGALFIASWLKDKGTWGKVLAVGLVAAAPIIGAAIAGFVVKGITSLFTKSVALLAKGAFNILKGVGLLFLGGLRKFIGLLMVNTGAKLLGGITKRAAMGSVLKTGTTLAPGAILAPGTSGFLADAMLAGGGLTQNAAKTGILKGIWGVVKKIGPWLLRAGKLFSTVGLIWLGIESILGIIKWWKGKDSNKGQSTFGSGRGTIPLSDSYTGVGTVGETSNNPRFVDEKGMFNGHRITSDYGMRVHPVTGQYKKHTGVDLAYRLNEDVGALAEGTVTFAGKKGGYGNTVIVTDSTGVEHLYGHLNSIGVGVGSEVKKGQVLGGAGQTGVATGVHLHYETRQNGSDIDPIAYLSSLGISPSSEKEIIGKRDKFTQNIVDYWNSRGKDKGFLHAKAHDYAKLAEKYKQEYANGINNEYYDPKDPLQKLRHDERIAIAASSQEAKDYANKKIAEFVKNAESAEATKKSIRVSAAAAAAASEKAEEIKDLTASASEQARAQWARINKEFKEDAEKQVIVPSDKQPIIDFPGTETCSKVLQNTINLQQQAFQQR